MATYVHGNVVRRETVPEHVQQPKRKEQQVRKKRSTPKQMNRGYVMFLACAACMALFFCVQHLKLQSDISENAKYIASLQQELTSAKEANSARYNAIMSTMNLEQIREKAMNEFGMVYASEDQIVRYQSPKGSSITQYAQIPESGIIVTSEMTE